MNINVNRKVYEIKFTHEYQNFGKFIQFFFQETSPNKAFTKESTYDEKLKRKEIKNGLGKDEIKIAEFSKTPDIFNMFELHVEFWQNQ